jgi:hypothetical protein
MYNTKQAENNITFDKILNLVDDYFIYCYYIGRVVPINKPISSPLRNDKNPSWSLHRDKKGVLRYKDFATGEGGNIIDFVKKLEGLKYHEALKKIWKDVILKKHVSLRKVTDPLVKAQSEETTIIRIKKKNFTEKDILFWSKYHITRDTLKLYEVNPIYTFWLNETQSSFYYTDAEPMYAYSIYDRYKIYRPHSKRQYKWRNNCSSFDVQGMEQLSENGDLLIITKSLKDVMVLHELGYNAIAPQSENSSIPKVIMDHLKLRFKRIVILFDYDEGGIQGSLKLSERYNIKRMFICLPYLNIYGIKDVSDYIKEFDKESTLIMLKQLLDENSNTK